MGPQGFGSQGSSATTGSIATKRKDRQLFLLQKLILLTLRGSLARCKWISNVALSAGAGAKVVDHPALSINSTKPRTGVDTFKVSTSSV